MAVEIWANNARSSLDSAIDDSQTTLNVVSGQGQRFPNPTAGDWFFATIDNGSNVEIIKVTTRATDSFSVIVRAQQGTTARAWNAGTRIENRITKETLETLQVVSSGNVAADSLWDVKGDLVVASGSNAASRLPVGSNTQVLTADSGETLGIKWATPTSGAPGDAKYIVSTANGTLSAEIVIPGQAGSPDISGIGGGGTSEEYDTGTTGLTWSSAPSVVDSNTTRLSYLYVLYNGSGETLGTKSWAPGSGAFDARTKISMAADSATIPTDASIHIGDSGNSNRALLQLRCNATTKGYEAKAFTYASSTFTQRGSSWFLNHNSIYLRITRDGSNNVSFYWSDDGYSWVFIATQSFSFTVANIGFRLSADSGTPAITMFSDWLRTSV